MNAIYFALYLIYEVLHYKKKFKCWKPEDLVIYGDYNSAAGNMLTISFKMCSGHDYCKSEAEIL